MLYLLFNENKKNNEVFLALISILDYKSSQ
jgi:hypothetical protein